MRIGPDGIDPLHEPGKLILVSVSDDYQPDEDESRDSVEFGDDGSIVAVDGITGSLNIRVETDADQRRALLAHLLAAEGLPGVEEIERAEKRLQSVRDFWGIRERALREEFRDTEHWDRVACILANGSPSIDESSKPTRQSRLHELLEAEARERVEVTTDEWSNERVRVDGKDVTINYAYGRVFLIDHDTEELDSKTVEDYDRLSLAFAALAEKNRREVADNA